MRPTSDRDVIVRLAAAAPAEPWRFFEPNVRPMPDAPKGPAAPEWDFPEAVQAAAVEWLKDRRAEHLNGIHHDNLAQFENEWQAYFYKLRTWHDYRDQERLKQWPVFYAHAVLEVVDRSLTDASEGDS